MKSMEKCGKAMTVLIALENQLGLFTAWQQTPRKRTLWMRALLMALALLPVASALAAAQCNQSVADLYNSKSPAVVLITALIINPYRMDDRVQQA
ncbi:MAG TPA: hypothetical protein VJ508_09145, partial [Saprospiraceae bacterium]|nr:hypothetical protein [Saprospiraceae bacterium]